MQTTVRHTGIVVRDLVAAQRFYGELLGFTVTARKDEAGPYLDNMLGVAAADITTLKMAAPGGGQLELIEVRAPRRNSTPPPRETTEPGITHMALTVDDLDATYSRLSGAGIRFNAPPQLSPDGGVKVTYCRDPEGNFLELVQPLRAPQAAYDTGRFAPVTDPGYLDLLRRRLADDAPELTFLAHFRDLVAGKLDATTHVLDIGCATGYAYKSFRPFGVRFTGVDVEEDYLAAARAHFAGDARASFHRHDIAAAPHETADIVICDAVIEHLPALDPALTNLARSTKDTLLLRTFLGPQEEIYSRTAPDPVYAGTHRKFSNQFAFTDVQHRLAELGFRSEILLDRYTGSLARLVDGVFRAFYVVRAERVDPL